MRNYFYGIFLLFAALFLLQCETIEESPAPGSAVVPGSAATIVVAGTLFYPDETGVTYLVPTGAQVIGAGGTDCVYIIESGGSVMAHSGTGNSYRVKSGGQFRGFTHSATSCTITYETGAIIEQEQVGPGTTFVSS